MPLRGATRAQVIALAEASAQIFVEEFGHPLDPSVTDWDGVAWAVDVDEIAEGAIWSAEEVQEAWALYQETLVRKTQELCQAPC